MDLRHKLSSGLWSQFRVFLTFLSAHQASWRNSNLFTLFHTPVHSLTCCNTPTMSVKLPGKASQRHLTMCLPGPLHLLVNLIFTITPWGTVRLSAPFTGQEMKTWKLSNAQGHTAGKRWSYGWNSGRPAPESMPLICTGFRSTNPMESFSPSHITSVAQGTLPETHIFKNEKLMQVCLCTHTHT